MSFVLNEGQQKGLDTFLSGQNMFITGSGGKGKSVLINKIKEIADSYAVFLSPTGIAALNIEGSTIHSTFRFPLGYLYKSRRENVSDHVQELFETDVIKTIIIDEISMVRSDVFSAMDRQLRKIKRRNIPFGGLQIVVVGDFFQLPPVINKRTEEGKLLLKEFKNEFCFSTKSWEEAAFVLIELQKPMRQKDIEFIGHLEMIRQKEVGYQDSIKFFNDVCSQHDPEDPVYLCTVNKNADAINEHFYDMLDGNEIVYEGVVSKSFKDRPVPQTLKLKVGAKVMCRANLEDKSMMNGETGYVTHLSNDSVIVKKTNGVTVTVKAFKWRANDYKVEGDTISTFETGTYTQIPLILAYGISIHKSQGLSLDEAMIHTGNGCFASGQIYVALSRLRTLQGLGLMNPLTTRDVIVDPAIVDFYENIRYGSLDALM